MPRGGWMLEISALWEMANFAIGSYSWARKNLNRRAAHAISRIARNVNSDHDHPRIRI